MRVRVILGLLVAFWSVLSLTACEENPGRVHAQREQLIGVYETKFDRGTERLELKSEGTYVQEFASAQGPFRHTGKWVYDDHILGGTDVELVDAVVSEDQVTTSPRIGTRTLNVHMRSGKLALALNEVADWYYERIG